MKYLLTINMNPSTWDALSEDDRNAVYSGHERFLEETAKSGEFICTKAVAEPAASATVRARGGAVEVADGLQAETAAFLCGYYLVDCADRERAIELAALVPEAAHTAVEVRAIVHEHGREA